MGIVCANVTPDTTLAEQAGSLCSQCPVRVDTNGDKVIHLANKMVCLQRDQHYYKLIGTPLIVQYHSSEAPST